LERKRAALALLVGDQQDSSEEDKHE